ncbi:unnamed protein product, partial [Meganyctiphanes norvegica]
MSMVASSKLLHLLEAFSTPWFLFSAPHHHHLVFFLLETFNNIIQYQFDGNSNLVYTIIRKRQVFHALANLPSDYNSINKSLHRRGKSRSLVRQPSGELSKGPQHTFEGAQPAQPAQPGTKTATLAAMPDLEKMTEKESAHPSSQQLHDLSLSSQNHNGDLVSPVSPTTADAPPSLPIMTTDEFTNNDHSDKSCSLPKGTGIQPPVEHQIFTKDNVEAEEKHLPRLEDGSEIEGSNNVVGLASMMSCAAVEDQEGPVGLLLPWEATGSTPFTDADGNTNMGIPTYPDTPVHGKPAVDAPQSPALSLKSGQSECSDKSSVQSSARSQAASNQWCPSSSWVLSWKTKLPLQTIMRLLQVLVPQVEKICID